MTDDPMDLVAILRADGLNCTCNAWYSAECCCGAVWADGYIGEAADEIERLRAAADELAEALRDARRRHQCDCVDGYDERTGAAALAAWAKVQSVEST